MFPILPEAHRRALDTVCRRLDGRTLAWGVSGSVALALHGIRTTCDDLDLVTTADGAMQIEEAFLEAIFEPVALETRGGIRGHLGRLTVEGIEVEVLGDIQNATGGGRWTDPPRLDEHVEWLDAGKHRFPVLTLAYLRRAYEAMGRPEKARLVAAELAIRGQTPG